jgi:hypothetical protein
MSTVGVGAGPPLGGGNPKPGPSVGPVGAAEASCLASGLAPDGGGDEAAFTTG